MKHANLIFNLLYNFIVKKITKIIYRKSYIIYFQLYIEYKVSLTLFTNNLAYPKIIYLSPAKIIVID